MTDLLSGHYLSPNTTLYVPSVLESQNHPLVTHCLGHHWNGSSSGPQVGLAAWPEKRGRCYLHW